MSDTLVVQSHKGPYTIEFDADAPRHVVAAATVGCHVIADRRVAELHKDWLTPLVEASQSVLLLDATEAAKSLENLPGVVQHLLSNRVRRDHRLVAVGGGVMQDITCFLSATLLRGVDWLFLPTTLLAQCDSCMGSKSSINCGTTKNMVGTFTPPRAVWIAARALDTLDERDVRSGVGEMLKVHAVAGPSSFDRIAADYDRLFRDRSCLMGYVGHSLAIKKPFCEIDEFDRAERNVLNFGHSFGHAIESATNFAVPHGIAVTMGMDVALEVAQGLGLANEELVARMRPVLRRNARGFLGVTVPMDVFFAALSKDKKNTGSGAVTVILPRGDGRVERSVQAFDEHFRGLCAGYFERSAACAT